MQKKISIVTHRIKNVDELPFSKRDYSEFKHGVRRHYYAFAKELANSLFTHLDVIQNLKVVHVYGAPYNKIEAASNILVLKVIEILRSKYPSISFLEGRIHRDNSYHEDYGKMTQEERLYMLSKESFKFLSDYTKADLSIFIDDIYITGSHEKMILDLLEKQKFSTPYMLAYYAKLEAITPADFESHINQYAFDGENGYSLEEFLKLQLYVNTRNCKFFLRQDHEQIKAIYSRNPGLKIWSKLVYYAQLNSYEQHELYEKNFNFLKSQL